QTCQGRGRAPHARQRQAVTARGCFFDSAFMIEPPSLSLPHKGGGDRRRASFSTPPAQLWPWLTVDASRVRGLAWRRCVPKPSLPPCGGGTGRGRGKLEATRSSDVATTRRCSAGGTLQSECARLRPFDVALEVLTDEIAIDQTPVGIGEALRH